MMHTFYTPLSTSAVPFAGGGLGVGTIPEVNVIDTGLDDKKYSTRRRMSDVFCAMFFFFTREG